MTSISKKPFYSSMTIIVVLPLVVFFIFGILIIFLGMRAFEEKNIDSIVHGFGGGSACLSAAGVLWHLVRREIITLQDENVFRFLVFGFLCFVVISWEILEYIILYPFEFLTYTDTIVDMICGLIGGLFALLFFRKPVLGKNSS
jgi:hypothetical protein